MLWNAYNSGEPLLNRARQEPERFLTAPPPRSCGR